MDQQAMFIFVVLCVVSLTHARCPSPEGLPTLFYPTKFFCAVVYTESHHNPALSCTGNIRGIPNGENARDIGNVFRDKVHAIVVRPGCKLLAYHFKNYQGGSKTFTGLNSNLQHVPLIPYYLFGMGLLTKLGLFGSTMGSWSCMCEFSNAALTCTPKEECTLLRECQNDGEGNMACEHSVSKGMTIGHSVTKGKSLSYSVEASISGTIKKIFTAGLKASMTTTYDWSRTDSKTFNKVTTTTVSCSVPPGKTLKMKQIMGRCGDTVVYTGYFNCSTE